MENYWLIGIAVTVFFVFCVSIYVLRRKKRKQSFQDVSSEVINKILMVVAQKGFQDYEYAVPKKVLEEGGYTVKVASQTKGKAQGKFGLEIEVEVGLDEGDHARRGVHQRRGPRPIHRH